MAKGKNTPIGDINEPWEGYLKGPVEDFIKKELKGRFGYIPPMQKQSDNYYHALCFASRESYAEYLSDRDAHAENLLLDLQIPISTEQGVADICTLTRESAGSIAISKKQASVTVSYLWQQYNPMTGQTTQMDEDAVVTISVRMQTSNGTWGAWDTTKQITDSIRSGQTKTFDVSSMITSDGIYQVRVVAVGETTGVPTSPVNTTILYSNVSLSYDGNVSTAYNGSSIQLPFRISGSTDKKLYVKIGSYAKPFNIGTTPYVESAYPATCTQSEFRLQRGVVSVEAWIAFGDGYAYETEHIRFQFIYIPAGDTQTTPIFAVTDVVDSFENWTRKKVFSYAVYNPSATVTPITIKLADRDTSEVYLSDTVECQNGVAYDYEENFAIEPSGDNVPTEIRGQFQFTNAQNQSFGNNINVTIDNRENFSATKGATFVLNPERKSIVAGSQSWALNEVMEDLVDTNSGWKEVTEVDSTGESVMVPVLSIAAGNKVTIPYNAFDNNTGRYLNGVEGSTTIEFDMRVSNIVGEEHPVVDMSVPYVDAFCGLKIYPTRAICLSRANDTDSLCDVGFQEDEREHIAINIIRNLRNEGINYVRIYMNGKCNREFVYENDDAFVPLSGQGKGSIEIGSDEADVEIFGIRIYKGVQLGSTQIQNDYMAGMPTIADKKLFRQYNSIYNGTEIEYDACNNMGYNTILRKIPAGGHYPSLNEQDEQAGVDVVVKIFTEKGNPNSIDRKHSGTFHNMTIKGQGTSAKGYYWWNISDGFLDDEKNPSNFNASNPTDYVKDGVNYRKLSWFNSEDGTSQVYASKYEIENGRGGITKLNGKANYASMQQSHKLGNIWLYDELWQRLVNNGSGGRPVLPGHAACYEKPFLCFYQIGDETPVFCGFQTWGSAKGDKKTFGFDKTASPGYMCVSGADNGAVAALFQMPIMVNYNSTAKQWEGNISYQQVIINTGDKKKGYCYKNGNSNVLSFEVEIANKYDKGDTLKNGNTAIGDELKGDSETTFMVDFAKFTQFVCASSPLLLPYNGTKEQLADESETLETDHQYWISANNSDRYKVFYFNPATKKYEELPCIPTAWGTDGRHTAMGTMKLTQQLAGLTISVEEVGGVVQKTIEEALDSTSDVNIINEYLSRARVEYFKAHAESYIDVPDAVFQQCWVRLEAATDNRTKNTYPWIDGTIDKLVRWKNDDDDTVKNTDNQGQLTKPYHILEHDKDGDGKNYWNGENNVFFTLIERAYEDRMRTMMNDMFTAMSQISGSVFKYYEDRFFWVQRYFPAVAYNETARLLYEVAKYKYDNNIGVRPSQDPITQAIGDQLESELQYVKQRLPMLMSWCEYENFDGAGTMGWRSVTPTYGGRPTYDIEFTAYQYIYPKMSCGGNIAELYAKRGNDWVKQSGQYLCAPGETVRMVLTTDANTQFSLVWLNYCKKLSNLGTLSVLEEGSVAISGKRLRSLEIWSADGVANEFRPRGGINLNCRNLESVNLTNATFGGTFSANLPRCNSLLLGGTRYNIINVPETSALETLVVPQTTQDLKILAQPRLSSLTFTAPEGQNGMTNLQIFKIAGRHELSTYALASRLVEANPANILEVGISNVNWDACRADVLAWLTNKQAALNGSIAMVRAASDRYITFAEKLAMANLYGDIDNPESANNGGLYVSYDLRTINKVQIEGNSFMPAVGRYQFGVKPSPDTGNNFKIRDGKPAITWTLANTANAYATLVDNREGIINVTSLSDAALDLKHLLTVEVEMFTKNAQGEVQNLAPQTDSRMVGFYRHIPQVGDFAFADGTFDSQYQASPAVVGIVFMRFPINSNGEVVAERDATAYDVRVVSLANTVLTGSLSQTSLRWGLYPDNSGANGFSTGAAPSVGQAIKDETGLTSVFDIPTIGNITSSGMNVNGNSDYRYINNDSYIDDDENDGYKKWTSGSIVDYAGKTKTQKIMEHCRTILLDYLKVSLPETVEELTAEMLRVRNENGGSSLYDEFFYPAAYACYLYEPNVDGLCDQFKKGNWYLPAEGEMGRLYNFYRHGISADQANEHAEKEATTPIFANANARANKTLFSFTNSWYWTSSEYYANYAWYMDFDSGGLYNYGGKYSTGYVRAVAAFTFEL